MLRKPTIPTRAYHLLWFWLSGVFGLGMLGYLVWAEQRGLLTWRGAGFLVAAQVLPFCALLSAVGMLFRKRWSRKKRAAQAFEQRLQNFPPLEWS